MKVSFEDHAEHAAFQSGDAVSAAVDLRDALGLDGFDVECTDPDCPDNQEDDEDEGERMTHYRKVNGQFEVRES